jgi:addiction module RelE/StbE family toxin
LWNLEYLPSFVRQAAKLERTSHYESLKRAIIELQNSKDPTKLGSRKRGKLLDCYSYNITKSIRLLYKVNFNIGVITLLRVGDHKQVYGKD